MTGRELIAEIKKHDNIDLPICISVDYHPIYKHRRVYATGFLESNNLNSTDEIELLFDGYSNQDKQVDK